MKLLALETSCDETSASVVCDGCIRSNVVSSQIRLHAEYGGVVPELATREHLRNLPGVVQRAVSEAGLTVGDLEAVAVTQGPGLPNALMAGIKFAQGLAFLRKLPLIGINHHEAHLYSPWIVGNPPRVDLDALVPNVSLVVSGGHTLLAHVTAPLEHRVLGATLDDAAGECFDKTSKLLGLPYPGGPEMDRLAQSGNPKAHDFPRPMIHDGSDDFSFSGLKTSVRYYLVKHPELLTDKSRLADVCASIQAAIVDVLVTKTVKAARRLGVSTVTASGGVTCNSELRRRLESACRKEKLTLRLADRSLCTDNAGMVGILASWRLEKSPTQLETDGVIEMEPKPAWRLTR